ncbi:MAG: hypothetical protein NTW94_07785 [Legionellales bacterium]|nr:hypothetical protein [Legionellales bacterium]
MKTKYMMTLLAWCFFSPAVMADLVSSPNQMLLPEFYTVYTNGTAVINQPAAGFEERTLPTTNLYKGMPGCYIACYSHQKENAVYSVDEGVYVVGQVRVAGKYSGRVCEPTNFAGKDITNDPTFKALCTEKVAACAGNLCWAGGDTGGWFGLQQNPVSPPVSVQP